ncbi:MAG: hypothetical protein L0Y62_05650 [Nitrospirae bacterium]|nr:hypothetical protein [Nitrospirota bacterium]
MGIVKSIKKAFRKDGLVQERQLKTLQGLTKEQAEKRLGIILHELCVKYAVDFVKEQLNMGDTPFKGVSKSRFFHEVMLINFWMTDKVLGEKGKAVMDEIVRNYSGAFHISGVSGDIPDRFSAYYNSWNEHTGHHDEFGIKASRNIFGRESDIPFAQASFWIISYADKTVKAITEFKKTCAAAGVKI